MSSSADANETLIVRAPRWRLIPYLVVALCFVAMGMTFPGTTSISLIVGWTTIVFFGFCALIFSAQMLPGANVLTLTADGMVVRNLWRSHKVRFDEVDGPFRVVSVGDPANLPGLRWLARIQFLPRNKLIGFRLHGAAAQGRLAQWNQARYGIHGAMPAMYGATPDQLAALLNAHLDRWSARRRP